MKVFDIEKYNKTEIDRQHNHVGKFYAWCYENCYNADISDEDKALNSAVASVVYTTFDILDKINYSRINECFNIIARNNPNSFEDYHWLFGVDCYRSSNISLENIVYWFDLRMRNNHKSTDVEYYMVKRIITYCYCNKVAIFSAWFDGCELQKAENKL